MRAGRITRAAALVLAGVLVGVPATPTPAAAGDHGSPDEATAAAAVVTPPFTGPEPIIFVHGWNNDARTFNTMLGRFTAGGFPSDRLFTFEYDYDASTQVTAPRFETFVHEVLATTGAPRVDVVAYSMGSLSTRWCIKFASCADVVDDWISLGGPNNGTFWSNFCSLFSTGCGDMAPGSSVLAALNQGDPTPGDQVSWTTYRTTCDLVIVPTESTELAGADNVVLPGCLSHDDLVTDAGVYELVRARADERTAPSAPQALGGEPGDQEVTLTWSPPADDGGHPVLRYEVFEGATKVAEVTPPASAATTVSQTIPGLVNGDTYVWSVRAVNAVGPGAFSNQATVSPEAAPPSAPRDLTGIPGDRQVTLTWSPPLTGAPILRYEVFEGATKVAEVTPPPSASATVSERIRGLVAGDTYVWSVRAVNAVGPGAFSEQITVSPQAFPLERFTDVPTTHPFFAQIDWVAANGIASGFADGTYRPGGSVTRQAMAAFLHRLAGAPPGPTLTRASFRDVSLRHPFSREVEWVAREGIAQGYADGTFRPAAPVSRQAVAAFLHRMALQPTTAPRPPSFTDVPSDHPFFLAVEWMAGERIATGYDDRSFQPLARVTRQAMAAFLQRYAALAGEAP